MNRGGQRPLTIEESEMRGALRVFAGLNNGGINFTHISKHLGISYDASRRRALALEKKGILVFNANGTVQFN